MIRMRLQVDLDLHHCIIILSELLGLHKRMD